MPRFFYGFGNVSLVLGAKIGFSSRPYFAQTGNKPLKRSSFFDINILYISLAKIAFHIKKVYPPHLYPRPSRLQ